LTSSGGGYRALLSGAGFLQGLDARDSNVVTSGLYQAITYHASLSGGSWMMSSLIGNNYPTVSNLKESLWKQAFQNGPLDPVVPAGYLKVAADVLLKEVAGYDTTIIDVYGRFLSYQLLKDGGASTTLSSITTQSNFTSYNIPYPIFTALGAKTWLGECIPGPNGTTYEFTPYEFGSWDNDVSAFTPTAYIGTALKGGKLNQLLCTKNYDNLGYVFATSSDVWSSYCFTIPPPDNSTSDLDTTLTAALNEIHELTTSDLYARYPNPFFQYTSPTGFRNPANDIFTQETLTLVDGGQSLQNNPIFPMLQPARKIDVLLVNDNSADTTMFWPNGSEILTTYVQSFNQGLTRMPFIPSVDTFLSQGLNQHAVFFGCNDTNKMTIVWMPNTRYSFASNFPTSKSTYTYAETDGVIANGVQIAAQGGDANWGTCFGCALLSKTGQALPSDCTACLSKYCYTGN
jgi:lysophospholipase